MRKSEGKHDVKKRQEMELYEKVLVKMTALLEGIEIIRSLHPKESAALLPPWRLV